MISSYFVICRLNFRKEESVADSKNRRKKARENHVRVSFLLNEDEKEARRKYEREKKRLQRKKKSQSDQNENVSSANENEDVPSAYEDLRQANIEELRLKFSEQNPGIQNPFQNN